MLNIIKGLNNIFFYTLHNIKIKKVDLLVHSAVYLGVDEHIIIMDVLYLYVFECNDKLLYTKLQTDSELRRGIFK